MGAGVITDALEEMTLNALIHTLAVAPLASAVVAQYQNQVVISPDLVLANLSLANFDGYAPTTIASWRGPYTDTNGDLVIAPSVASWFSCTGQNTINTVYGTAILDSTGATLLAIQQYDLAITPSTGMQWEVTPEISVEGSLNACLC